MNETNTLYEFYLQNQNIICLSRSNRALVAKTNYCIFEQSRTKTAVLVLKCRGFINNLYYITI